ncbi:hypothetical protein [Streptomyces cyaneochromogenes]|nr:hypothetical protein [Streptomyces cyaneochromogenes]
MLSYLAAALPSDASAATRLLALQCALRMSANMQVRLPKGMLRSLRLDTPGLWRELEHARWLRTSPGSTTNGVVAELLDVTLLEQAPARPDRMYAADWALRVSSEVGVAGPLSQLSSLYLTAHTTPEIGSGQSELDQMAHVCGARPAELPNTLDRLAATGILTSWKVCLNSGDLHWTLAGERGRARELTLGRSVTGH